MCQGAVEGQIAPIEVSVSAKKLEGVNEFCYLGSCISSGANMEADFDRRIARASICFGQLWKRVRENRKLPIKTKIAVYTSCVLSTLLYGSETWSAYSAQITRLNTFHLRNLGRILGINWMDRVSNAEVLHRTQCDSMHTILTKRRRRGFGHVCYRLPKKVLFSEVSSGHRARGRHLLRFQDRIRNDLRNYGLQTDGVEKRCAERWSGEKGYTRVEQQQQQQQKNGGNTKE